MPNSTLKMQRQLSRQNKQSENYKRQTKGPEGDRNTGGMLRSDFGYFDRFPRRSFLARKPTAAERKEFGVPDGASDAIIIVAKTADNGCIRSCVKHRDAGTRGGMDRIMRLQDSELARALDSIPGNRVAGAAEYLGDNPGGSARQVLENYNSHVQKEDSEAWDLAETDYEIEQERLQKRDEAQGKVAGDVVYRDDVPVNTDRDVG